MPPEIFCCIEIMLALCRAVEEATSDAPDNGNLHDIVCDMVTGVLPSEKRGRTRQRTAKFDLARLPVWRSLTTSQQRRCRQLPF
jgi:hypothetical protein